MSEVTPNELSRSDDKDEQQTLLQTPNEKPADKQVDPLFTAFQATSTAAPRIEVGPVPLTRVAHYELIKEVGRGGMGVVFKARDVRLNRIVALKMIRTGALASADERQRFEREASAAAQLQHPNIVLLYEVSPYNEQPFLSMEFIGGTSLAERVSTGPLSCRRAAEYLEITARAVHYAHTKGIIHRDLKPANVLLDENDQPKVTDFGLAKQMETESDQTRTGAILGTPSYMSPEQAAGSKEITPASDVYSLGAILYELITGKPPFCGETPLKTLKLVAEQDPVAPRVLSPTIDIDLETICLKCLEKTPGRRYETAEALADDLRRYLNGEPITARRVSLIGRGIKWVWRNPTWTAIGVTLLVSVAAFMIFMSYIAYEEKDLREQADKAKEVAAKRLDAMRHLLYLSEMRQAQQALRRADLDGGLRILNDRWRPREQESDLRDWEWYFLKERAESRLAFGSHKGQAFAVDYSPDGRFLASAGGEFNRPGEIKIWEVRTGRLVRTIPAHAAGITSIAHHPRGTMLASASLDKTVKIWNLETGAEIVTLRGHGNNVYHVAFSPKGDRLASASHDLKVRVFDWERYAKDPDHSIQVLTGHDLPVTALAFHPRLDLLVTGSSDRPIKTGGKDRTIKVWNLTTGQIERSLTGHEGDVASLAFSADGAFLVSGGGAPNQRGEVLYWNFEKGEARVIRNGLSERILDVSISRDGKVAAAGADGLVRVWNNIVTSEAQVFRGDPQSVHSVAFAPDGFSLASAGRSGRVSLWSSSAGLETLTLSAPGSMRAVGFHPRLPYLATAGSPRGDVRVWNLEHPESPVIFTGHKGGVSAVAFSPDGRFLASGGDDRTVRIVAFPAADKAPLVLEGHTALVYSIAYRPDGGLIASAGEDERIYLHDPSTGQLVKTLVGHENSIRALAFSPDGQWLASGSWDKTVRLWDLKNDVHYLLAGHTGLVNAIAFSPKGALLASAGTDRIIRVWNVERRQREYDLEGTPGEVQSIAFHPAGGRIVSVGSDRLIRLWDVVTRQEIFDFEEHVGTLRCVAFSADGRSLAGAGNGVVRVWQASRDIVK